MSFVLLLQVKLTAEQARIANHTLSQEKNDEIIKIVAFAGTGKTTTLIKMCQNHPHLKFLVIVYNKSVQENCEKSFPKNATVRTAHSLAWKKVGWRYKGEFSVFSKKNHEFDFFL